MRIFRLLRHGYGPFLRAIGSAALWLVSGWAFGLEGEPRCTPNDVSDADYWVCAIGDRRSMLKTGYLGATYRLSELDIDAAMVGVGPVEGLKGEITIVDGTTHVSVINDGAEAVFRNRDVSGIFLAYGGSKAWHATPIDQEIPDLDRLEIWVRERLESRGLNTDRPTPFFIDAVAKQMTYHIIFKDNDVRHDRAQHQLAKKKFSVSHVPVRIIGVWADPAGVGRYTHEGKRIHVHGVVGDGIAAGHIDRVSLLPGSLLNLPDVQRIK